VGRICYLPTPVLINRYFGSKERLFAEVLAKANEHPIIATQETLYSPKRAETIARPLVQVTAPDATALDGFLIMLRSFSSERAVEIARDVIEAHHQRNVTTALSGNLAPQRAALLLALVAGVQIMRQMIGLTALSTATDEELESLLKPLIERLMDG